ncbi:MAG: chromate transporter [Methylococcaceae bacterium]
MTNAANPGPGFIELAASGVDETAMEHVQKWHLILARRRNIAVLGWVIVPLVFEPHFKKHSKRPGLMAFVDGITAAAVGAIAGSVIVLGMRSITDTPTAVLAIGTTLLLLRFKKLPEPAIVLTAALIGLGIHPPIS